MKEFTSAVEEVAKERSEEEIEGAVEFMLDGRKMTAYMPAPEQLTFMMATMGRGQTNDSRFASLVNLFLECFDPADKDYLESRLVTWDRTKRLPLKKFEEMFEYVAEGWFGTPTQPPSDSAPSQANGGKKSKAATTKSTSSD